MDREMNVRVYYNESGSVKGIVIIDEDDWNLIEHIDSIDDKYATFPLEKDLVNLIMDGPDTVNLEEVKKYEYNLDTPKQKNGKQIVNNLWLEYGDVILDENDKLEQGWAHFSPDTDKWAIMKWIERTYNVSVLEEVFNDIIQ